MKKKKNLRTKKHRNKMSYMLGLASIIRKKEDIIIIDTKQERKLLENLSTKKG